MTNRPSPPHNHILCDRCGALVASTNGRFLKTVVVLCGECLTRTKWYPAQRVIDKKIKPEKM